MKKIIFYWLLGATGFGFSQTIENEVLRFDEYLGIVKKYHPFVKQANLILDESQAELLKSRGAFDPKIQIDYDRKKFKGSEYFDKLNATFKIPTWYGVELKGNFENNDGEFLNPEGSVPIDGLYSAGVSFNVAQGLVIDKRRAALKQARFFTKQAKADRIIEVNDILFEASLVYFNWLRTFNEMNVYKDFLQNAEIRFNGVKKNVEVGEAAAIDSVEARITLNNRKLNLEKARIKLRKAALELSNFLWLENNIPIEIRDNVIPDVYSEALVDETLQISELNYNDVVIENHPKLRSINYKFEGLLINKRLKANMLLPKVELQYNFLSEEPEIARSFSTSAYKSGLNLSFPLFLRKERGDLKLAKLKLRDTEYQLTATKQTIKNKVTAVLQELQSYVLQNDLTEEVVRD
ncbi:MAG: transporter, partial [Flavobacteriaceae bacterium]